MTDRPSLLRRGALVGLALLLSAGQVAADSLRERIHREYRHQNYMLIEDETGWTLYLFADEPSQKPRLVSGPHSDFSAALAQTRSSIARERVRGLVALAGAEAPEALDIALLLLNDPSAAVRDEAQSLILDHPDGAEIAAALGLVDDLEGEEDEDADRAHQSRQGR